MSKINTKFLITEPLAKVFGKELRLGLNPDPSKIHGKRLLFPNGGAAFTPSDGLLQEPQHPKTSFLINPSEFESFTLPSTLPTSLPSCIFSTTQA